MGEKRQVVPNRHILTAEVPRRGTPTTAKSSRNVSLAQFTRKHNQWRL